MRCEPSVALHTIGLTLYRPSSSFSNLSTLEIETCSLLSGSSFKLHKMVPYHKGCQIAMVQRFKAREVEVIDFNCFIAIADLSLWCA